MRARRDPIPKALERRVERESTRIIGLERSVTVRDDDVMKMKVRAIVFREYGHPAEVAFSEEIEEEEMGKGEALVRLLAAPINPADLNVLEGKYGKLPKLPAVVGVEGVGRVEAISEEVEGLAVGDMVLLPLGYGTWREVGVVRADLLWVVPAGIEPEQASMLGINPPTALRMLRDFVDLKPGDWVIQNAANSGVGRAVIGMARAAGLRTVNVVRRAELIDELKALGADVVLVEGENLSSEIIVATSDAPARLALNAVGGESALRMASALATSGTVVTYGAMGRKPLRIPNGLLIFKDIRWRGFWISKWYGEASRGEIGEMLAEVFRLSLSGVIAVPVERVYGLAEVKLALERAACGERSGKILFGGGKR